MSDVDREPCCGHPYYNHESSTTSRREKVVFCWDCKPGDACYFRRMVLP